MKTHSTNGERTFASHNSKNENFQKTLCCSNFPVKVNLIYLPIFKFNSPASISPDNLIYLFQAFNKHSLSSFLHLSTEEAVNNPIESNGSRNQHRIHLRNTSLQPAIQICNVTSVIMIMIFILFNNSVLTKNEQLKLKMKNRIFALK